MTENMRLRAWTTNAWNYHLNSITCKIILYSDISEFDAKHYRSPIPESGGAFRVSVYSPYVILNKTGMDVMVKSKSLMQSARAAAGQVQSGKLIVADLFRHHLIRIQELDKSQHPTCSPSPARSVKIELF